MGEYDLVVVGAGTGNNVASAAARSRLDTALVEKRALDGTCPTRGCDPSRTLVHRADLVEQIRRAGQFGIEAELTDIDFSTIVRESNESYRGKAEQMAEGMRDAENLTLYEDEAEFVDDPDAVVRRLDDIDVGRPGTGGPEFRDPWGTRVQVVAYEEIQFTKADHVLRGIGLANLGKSDSALEELAHDGMAPE